MKRIFAVALVAITFAACQKDEIAAPQAAIKTAATAIGQGEVLVIEANLISGRETTIDWSIDGQVVKPSGGLTFEFESDKVGDHIVKMTAKNSGGEVSDEVKINVFYLMDFEDVPENYLAGPTASGANLYHSFGADQYIGYADAARGVEIMMPDDLYAAEEGIKNFWYSGVAISQWNNMAASGSDNQCSAYFKDSATGFGGYGGSKTFAVDFGNHTLVLPDDLGNVAFSDEKEEGTFRYFWVNNSTYAALSMLNGDDYNQKFETGDWFKLTITAKDAAGNDTGSPVEFYLADFRTGSNKGVVKEWTKVDLTPLGSKVHKIVFDLTSSDNGNNHDDKGMMNTPAYFCFDNLAFSK